MTTSRQVPQYIVVGHVTKDLVPDDDYRLGGTATYAALAAARLGLCVGVLTSVSDDVVPFPANSVQLANSPSPESTVFENIYIGQNRKQYIRGVARELGIKDLPEDWRQASIVHLGPIAQEVNANLVDAFDHALIGVTPQGWLRRWDRQGLVSPTEWVESERILDSAHAVILSLEDLGGNRAQLEAYIKKARVLVLTLGEHGAIVYEKGGHQRVRAYAVDEVDPTGAGDVFAAAFLIRYSENQDAVNAARFANCVASFVVEGFGSTTIPTREQVEERLRIGRLRK